MSVASNNLSDILQSEDWDYSVLGADPKGKMKKTQVSKNEETKFPKATNAAQMKKLMEKKQLYLMEKATAKNPNAGKLGGDGAYRQFIEQTTDDPRLARSWGFTDYCYIWATTVKKPFGSTVTSKAGLFARDRLYENDFIGEYFCTWYIFPEWLQYPELETKYALCLDGRYILEPDEDCIVQHANDPGSDQRKCNAAFFLSWKDPKQWRSELPQCYLAATCEIAPGEEILVDYGWSGRISHESKKLSGPDIWEKQQGRESVATADDYEKMAYWKGDTPYDWGDTSPVRQDDEKSLPLNKPDKQVIDLDAVNEDSSDEDIPGVAPVRFEDPKWDNVVGKFLGEATKIGTAKENMQKKKSWEKSKIFNVEKGDQWQYSKKKLAADGAQDNNWKWYEDAYQKYYDEQLGPDPVVNQEGQYYDETLGPDPILPPNVGPEAKNEISIDPTNTELANEVIPSVADAVEQEKKFKPSANEQKWRRKKKLRKKDNSRAAQMRRAQIQRRWNKNNRGSSSTYSISDISELEKDLLGELKLKS